MTGGEEDFERQKSRCSEHKTLEECLLQQSQSRITVRNFQHFITLHWDIAAYKIKPCKTVVPNRIIICLDANIFFGQQACPLECVTCNFFLISLLFQAGIYPRHTKEQEKYRSYMFYVSIFQRFWTFVLYNYTLQLQGKNGQNKPENPQN